MQSKNTESCTFRHRTDLLSVQLGINVNDLPTKLGISRRTLFAGRANDLAVSRKTWLKLEEAELERTRISGGDLAQLRRNQGITEQEAADSLGIEIDEYRTLEASNTITLGFLKRLQLLVPKQGGGERGLKLAHRISANAEELAKHRIADGTESGAIIREAIELLKGYLKEPEKIYYLAEAQGMIHKVLIQRLEHRNASDEKRGQDSGGLARVKE